jgi:hypothetical protein
MTTYMGVICKGQVQLADPIYLPEGSQVYVVVPTTITEQVARRKANRWLLEHVGNLVMADKPVLAQSEDRIVWRFHAFVTASSHEPWGPIGEVDVSAATGEVLTSADEAEEMIQRGEHFASTAPPASR